MLLLRVFLKECQVDILSARRQENRLVVGAALCYVVGNPNSNHPG